MVLTWRINNRLTLNIVKCKPIIIGSTEYIERLDYNHTLLVIINM